MFTGIVKAIAEVEKAEKRRGSLFLYIKKPRAWRFGLGESVLVNGVCLTAKKIGKASFVTEFMSETLSRTTFGREIPRRVNLEKPLTLKDPLGGHIVLGHVDAVGKIIKIKSEFSEKKYFFSFPKKYSRLVVEKGSIAVDGVSLTVAGRSKVNFSCSLLDYTLKLTILGQKRVGDIVNIEFDILAKYLLG
ncbi:MAG: Riboflavin synthase alpha chain [Parcubacteria group bacterium Gr01-1014_30]|nr:MAG: Riboflavin synthase alpha chain [Parcubacteria group bacterium Gr01-1014_30]